MRGGLLLAAMAARLGAQAPAVVHVLSDESQVPVGRTLRMRAVVRDAAGNAIANAPVTWSVNQAAAGTIAPDGVFTARGLATVRVTARSGSAAGEAAIQTIPSRIAITPETVELEIGARQGFQASAFDADGRAIPGVNFTWSLTNQRQGTSSLGRIDNTGTMTGTGEGGAWVWATYTYNETFPGLQRQWVAYAKVAVNAPRMYELRKLYAPLRETRKQWTLRARQSMIWSTDDGQLLFNASLGGLANALLSWKNGEWKAVSVGGVPRFGRASMALEFRIHSVTRDGQILTYEDTNINGAELNLGTRDGVEPFLSNNVPLGNTEAVSGLAITRNSYSSSGYAAVRANFRFPEEQATTYVGVFRGLGRVDELLIGTRDRVPEIGGAFAIDGDFGVAGDGTAHYSVSSGANRVFYRHDFEGRRKLIAVGDKVLGSAVRSFPGGGTYRPATWFDEDGTAVVAALLEDGTLHYLSFARDGTMTSLRLTSQAGILYRHPAHGVLFYGNPHNNQGNGAHLWAGGASKPVYVLGRRLFDQAIQDIDSGTVDRQGNVTLMLRGDRRALMAVRMSAEPELLFGSGDEVPVAAPVNAFTFIGGAKTGPPHLQAGGNAGSAAEFNGKDFDLTLGIGERLAANTMWYGGTTSSVRKAPNGDLYFVFNFNTAGIARIPRGGGAPQTVLSFPLALRVDNANLTVNAPTQIDVNGQGAVLFHSSTSAGDNRFFLHRDGETKQLLALSPTAVTASTIDGRTVDRYESFALDNNGRVLAQLRFRNLAVPALAVWDGARWKTVAVPNETQIGQRTVASLPSTPRGAGDKLISGLTLAGGLTVVAEWQDPNWTVAVASDTVMPNGQVANSVGALDLNARGDALFQYSNGVNSMVVRRDGKFHQVHNFFRPTPDGDWLIRINAMDLRDDGTVYFLAVTEEDEVALYEARPLY